MKADNAARRRRNWILIGGVLLIMLLTTLSGQPPQRLPTPYFDLPAPMVIAHQGGNLLRPGDTMLAFDHAVALGADVLEMDVHLSRDGQVVVIHDATVDRTTDGQGAVAELTMDDLRRLDAAYHWPFHGDERPYRGQGVQIPTFSEVAQKHPQQRMVVELKQADAALAEALCASLKHHTRQDLTLVASYHQDALDYFRRACPATATSASADEVTWFLRVQAWSLPQLFTAPSIALQVPAQRDGSDSLTPAFVRAANAANLQVEFWTLNEPAEMRRAIAAGAQGIMTDRPDLLLDELGRL